MSEMGVPTPANRPVVDPWPPGWMSRLGYAGEEFSIAASSVHLIATYVVAPVVKKTTVVERVASFFWAHTHPFGLATVVLGGIVSSRTESYSRPTCTHANTDFFASFAVNKYALLGLLGRQLVLEGGRAAHWECIWITPVATIVLARDGCCGGQ